MPLTTAERAVLGKIDEHQLIELTRSLVRADGQNPPGDEAATVAVLAGAAAELGFDVREAPVQPGRNNLQRHTGGRQLGPACCCSGIPMWCPSATGGRGIPSAARSRTAASTDAARLT